MAKYLTPPRYRILIASLMGNTAIYEYWKIIRWRCNVKERDTTI